MDKKGNRLTAAERKRRAEEMKLKMKKDAEDNRARIKREDLARELRLRGANRLEVDGSLKKLIRSMNYHWVKDEMRYRWAEFERQLDMKDWRISQLLKSLLMMDTHLELSRQHMMELMDTITGTYFEQASDVHRTYVVRRRKLVGDRNAEASHYVNRCRTQRDTVEALLEAARGDNKTRIAEVRRDLERLEEYQTRRYETDLVDYSMEFNLRMEQTWDDHRRHFDDYKRSTEDKRKLYVQLRKKDEKDTEVIERLATKISTLNETIAQHREHMVKTRETNKKIKDLRTERERFSKSYDIIRQRIKKSCEHDYRQMTVLTTHANVTIQKLEGLKSKAEEVLKVVTMCRKLETVEEKVLPFLRFSRRMSLPAEELVPDQQDLTKLIARTSQVMLQNDYLKSVVDRLRMERAGYKKNLNDIIKEQYAIPDVKVVVPSQ
ncbi:hypothetical protein AAG570_006156 [Ranatra chinensis]|uniref:Dynein regulatory complex protein 1/2 N-terminal domain-containing protein n=1 Tax=Ranatra chinensis TaxID=642074 RepID=A0ABD0XX82_9HEMI